MDQCTRAALYGALRDPKENAPDAEVPDISALFFGQTPRGLLSPQPYGSRPFHFAAHCGAAAQSTAPIRDASIALKGSPKLPRSTSELAYAAHAPQRLA